MTIDQFLAFPLEIHRDCALADLRHPLSLDAASAAALRASRAPIASGRINQLEIIELTQRHAAFRIAGYERLQSVAERADRLRRGLKRLYYGFDVMEIAEDQHERICDLIDGLRKDPEVFRLWITLKEVANQGDDS
jgi:hypothetical protein